MGILGFINEMIKVYFINRERKSSHFSHLENHCHYDMQHQCRPLTLTGLEGHISLPGKGWEGHICPSVVTSWWHHCDII